MHDIDCQITIKNNNTIHYDLGYLRAGDVERIMFETLSVLDQLERPFYTVLDMKRMIQKHSLIHPEDYDTVGLLSRKLDNEGRIFSIWIVPEKSVLYKTLEMLVPAEMEVIRVDTGEEAETLIRGVVEPVLL